MPVDDLNGRHLIATVAITRRSALATLWSAMREDRDVVSLAEVFPPGVRPEEYAEVQCREFVESRQVAAAAPAQAVDSRSRSPGAALGSSASSSDPRPKGYWRWAT